MMSSDSESAEELLSFSNRTFTLEEPDNIPTIPTKISDILVGIVLTEDTISHKLLSLKGNKAPRPDGLHPHILKSCAATLTKPLLLLTQQSLASGSLPDFWKKVNVTPIHKKGSKVQPSNYQPISLTSQVVKLIESIIREQLWDFLVSIKL